ncbi:fibulin-1-like [Acropora muricata]|uniref:fibulin-1-like n=1 Tax=Acropora muricata TaxID=159855 RepID=UPI0034E47411
MGYIKAIKSLASVMKADAAPSVYRLLKILSFLTLDFDECQSNQTNSCSQLCINAPGSYSCACQNGYSLNDDKESCDDINECIKEDYFNCTDPHQHCVNTPGSYKCECEMGLQLIDGKCQDIDECNSTKPLAPCDQICENIFGSYNCSCQKGFNLVNGSRCEDFDECQSNQTNSCSQLCINAPGSYSCACQNGYSLNDDKESCDALNGQWSCSSNVHEQVLY